MLFTHNRFLSTVTVNRKPLTETVLSDIRFGTESNCECHCAFPAVLHWPKQAVESIDVYCISSS